jgi:hypothetical protein
MTRLVVRGAGIQLRQGATGNYPFCSASFFTVPAATISRRSA